MWLCSGVSFAPVSHVHSDKLDIFLVLIAVPNFTFCCHCLKDINMALVMWLHTAFLISPFFFPNYFLTGRHPRNLTFLYRMLILSMHFFFAGILNICSIFTHPKIQCKSHLFIVRILFQILAIIVIYHSTCHLKFSQKMLFFQQSVNSGK